MVKVKKSKIFRQEGFTFAFFRLLQFDYQQLTQGETPPKFYFVFTEGFTSLYCLTINPLYPHNHIGETPCPKSFTKNILTTKINVLINVSINVQLMLQEKAL